MSEPVDPISAQQAIERAEFDAEMRRRKRIVWREKGVFGPYVAAYVCGEVVAEGGWYETGGKLRNWMSRDELKAFSHRAWQRSDNSAPRDPLCPSYIPAQCGGCRWFAALNSDWGFCCNERSLNDGRVVFEHGGCPEHSQLVPA